MRSGMQYISHNEALLHRVGQFMYLICYCTKRERIEQIGCMSELMFNGSVSNAAGGCCYDVSDSSQGQHDYGQDSLLGVSVGMGRLL